MQAKPRACLAGPTADKGLPGFLSKHVPVKLASYMVCKQQPAPCGGNAVIRKCYQAVRLKSFKSPHYRGIFTHHIKGYAPAGSKGEHERFRTELVIGEFFTAFTGQKVIVLYFLYLALSRHSGLPGIFSTAA